jgi:hypothetical protein
LIQNNFVEHRGVPYAILLGTARQQWRVAIYPVPNQLPKERTVFGTREDAVTTARSMINSWLKRQQRTVLGARQATAGYAENAQGYSVSV